MKQILLVGLIAILVIGCKKSNISSNQNYVGIWANINGNVISKLEVKSNGKSFYEEATLSGNTTKSISYNGKFILEGSTLQIGFKKFTINKEPSEKSGVWFLTMDNIDYTGK